MYAHDILLYYTISLDYDWMTGDIAHVEYTNAYCFTTEPRIRLFYFIYILRIVSLDLSQLADALTLMNDRHAVLFILILGNPQLVESTQ